MKTEACFADNRQNPENPIRIWIWIRIRIYVCLCAAVKREGEYRGAPLKHTFLQTGMAKRQGTDWEVPGAQGGGQRYMTGESGHPDV